MPCGNKTVSQNLSEPSTLLQGEINESKISIRILQEMCKSEI